MTETYYRLYSQNDEIVRTFSSKSDELLFFAGELCSELELLALVLVSFFVVRSSMLKNDDFDRVLRRSVAEASLLRT